ncbi:PREDICTED: uncharacterized protein LOC105361435 [Ceratosolen solmsi marchali]|uniref:Uncharacterized protein LOC105361435 n=1 Tax=Ceratosolen solmsi marchali TaxID=326594 RepID=A0AAJ6YF46_9HYME|nr:PREDICTED: uncharacterized protein LOC105361435 [Ceratosolen solmsi marchali]
MAGFGKFTKVFLVLSIFILVQCNAVESKTIPQFLRSILNAVRRIEKRLASYAHLNSQPAHEIDQKKKVIDSSTENDMTNENSTLASEQKNNDIAELEKVLDKPENINVDILKEHQQKIVKHPHHGKVSRKPVPIDIESSSKESEENKKFVDDTTVMLDDESDDSTKVNHKTKNSHHNLQSDMKKVHSNGDKRVKKIKKKPVLLKEDE